MGGGGRLCNVGGAYLFFLHSLMGKKKNLQGPRPPQATMWLRPLRHLEECSRGKSPLDMASIARICVSTAGGTFQEAQEMRTCLMNIEEGKKHKNI